jgi:class I fructose-bisphosphate aldolase/fructose-bisphosphate aldolase/2-amino-3,7-dideoxy-D-threo-hept-6-ulosonate synthase
MSLTPFSAVGAGKTRRFRRMFKADGRALFVAIDHAAYLGAGPPLTVVDDIALGQPDAVLATWHLARANPSALANAGLVLRVDGGISDLGGPAGSDVSSLVSTVDDAIRIGADAVVVLAFPGTPDEEVSLRRLTKLVGECEAAGLVVMAEALPGGFGQSVPWTFENVARASRIAAEMGADIIKTACPGPPEQFAEIVAACPVPVVALGGPKVDNEEDIVAFTRGIVSAGGAGVAIGRNCWGSPDPTKLVERLMEAVHG